MEMEGIVSMISSIGFPIVACIFMWKFIGGTLQDFTKTVEENTRMLQKLCDRLDSQERRDPRD